MQPAYQIQQPLTWGPWLRVTTLLPRKVDGRWVFSHYVRYGESFFMLCTERTLRPYRVGNVVPFRRADGSGAPL